MFGCEIFILKIAVFFQMPPHTKNNYGSLSYFEIFQISLTYNKLRTKNWNNTVNDTAESVRIIVMLFF